MTICKSTLKSKKWLLVMAAVVFLAGCKDSKAGDADSGSIKQEENLSLPFIVVDLDGDGIELIPLEESNVYFDVDGDGLAERTAWVHPDDGILGVYQPQNDLESSVDGKERLRKMVTLGVSALKKLDRDGDGYLNKSKDHVPLIFSIWKDSNSNGYPDAGERLGSDFLVYQISLPLGAGEGVGLSADVGVFLVEGKMQTVTKSNVGYREIKFLFSDDDVDWDVEVDPYQRAMKKIKGRN